MPQYPFPPPGPGAEEPLGSTPLPGAESGPADGSTPMGIPAADGSSGGPDDGWGKALPDGPEQGLFMCLPAETMELSRFAGEDGHPAMPPGPLLAGVAAAVAGGDGSGLAGVSEDFLFAVITGGRRMASWGTWLEFSAMRELALRHPAVPRRPAATQAPAGTPMPAATQAPATPGAEKPAGSDDIVGAAVPADDGRIQFGEFVPDELSLELRMTWGATAERISYACALAGRLPVTFAALGGGLIDPVHAKIISEQTDILSAADAATADAVLAAAAQHKTYGELRAHAARLALKLDPDAAERRQQARRRDAHVRAYREESGNAGISAREMPSDEVLASMQQVDQRARDLRAAGIPGTLEHLRVRAYLDLLQERDTRLTHHNPDQDHGPGQDDGSGGNNGPGGTGGSGRPGWNGGPGGNSAPGNSPARPRGTGPSLAAMVNLTVPLGTALGESGTPGEAAGFGLLDPQSARDLLAAAARDPRTRWCVTTLHPDGAAAAHGCASGQHPPPGPKPPGPEPPDVTPPRPEPPVPEPPRSADTAPWAQEYLRGLKVQLTMIARDTCDHRHAETGYKPSRRLQHLIQTRNTCCTAPGCGRSAARCDLDHTLAWHLGGRTCECGLAPLCRHHHRVKQAKGWRLEQPEPGVLVCAPRAAGPTRPLPPNITSDHILSVSAFPSQGSRALNGDHTHSGWLLNNH